MKFKLTDLETGTDWTITATQNPSTPAPPAPGPTPTATMTVKGSRVLDSKGVEFIGRGVNASFAWGNHVDNLKAVAEIAKSGANCVRAAFAAGLGYDTPAERRVVVEEILRHKMIAIVGCWLPWIEGEASQAKDARYADPKTLAACVDYWLQPDSVAMLKQYKDRVILNIANEWGGWDGAAWLAAYSAAVKRLRDAGVDCLIMIDGGGGYGQNPRTARNFGKQLLAADPLHNIVFSVHFYAYWRTTETAAGTYIKSDDTKIVGKVGTWNDGGAGTPWALIPELAALKAAGLAVFVGEIAWQEHAAVAYVTTTALADLRALGMGFAAWVWAADGDPLLDIVKRGALAFAPANLTAGGAVFAEELKTAVRATVF